ncbi:endo alpha-1,4 polygalactosaminidase [Actinophytocola sp.]|uniref:endo alpha-1,4 polygalactosaminidase n=1 Tax=Actinophytocola sp. TaxID=1872138 RepID=UPI002ED96C1B
MLRLVVLLALVVAGCGRADGSSVAAFPADVPADYQLGGAYPPPDGVGLVVRDRTAAPADGAYNVCYVNGFQTQPDAIGWWRREHDELLLRDAHGNYVEDKEWGELLLDITTPANREAIAGIVGPWIAGCAADGYEAVEIDNLDTYDRSGGLVDRSAALAYATLLTRAAHDANLAIGQKNAPDIAAEAHAAGFDFAIAEECGRYDECAGYTGVYGDAVLVIEYRREDFATTCAGFGDRLSVVLRDVALTTPDAPEHTYDAC